MKREEFEALVRKLEEKAAKDPAGYRFRIGALASLGYGFVLFLLLGLIALIGRVIGLIAVTRRVNAAEGKILLFLGIGASRCFDLSG
jgi:hypothetical protein